MAKQSLKQESNELKESLLEVTTTLRQIANCLGYNVINGERFKGVSEKDKVGILYLLEFDRRQIAAILGKDVDVVSVNLSQLGLTSRTKGRTTEKRIDGQNQSAATKKA